MSLYMALDSIGMSINDLDMSFLNYIVQMELPIWVIDILNSYNDIPIYEIGIP